VNRRNIAIIVILAALLAGGFALYRRLKGAGSAGLTQYKVNAVDTGEVKKTVSATGTLQAWTTVDIKSKAGGLVEKMAVDVGSVVKQGQILARIDPTDSQTAFDQAQADLTSSRAKVQQSDTTYQLQVKQSQISIADAEANLDSSRASRNAAAARLNAAKDQSNAQPELTRTAIANSQAAYDQAVKQRHQLDATNAQDRGAAQSAYDQAVANAENSRLESERPQALLAKGYVSQQTVDSARAAQNVNQAQVASAKIKLDTLTAEQNASIQTADARVAQAKAALESARASSVEIKNKQDSVKELAAALQQADSDVARAEVAVQQAKANQANNTIRGYDIKQAMSTVTRNQASMNNAQTVLTQTIVRAPSEGIVLQKYVEQERSSNPVSRASPGARPSCNSAISLGCTWT